MSKDAWKLLFIILIAFVVVLLLYSPNRKTTLVGTPQGFVSGSLPTVQISVDNRHIKAFVASTYDTMTRGLGGRSSLNAGEGMWFEFGSKSKWGIWMKDMQFPIDIIWIDENLRVVMVAEKISPDTFPKVFYPSLDALFVLEVPSGFVENSHVEVGNMLSVQ